MENRLFDPQALAILLDASRWRVVSSLFTPDTRPLRNRALRAWAERTTGSHAQQEVVIGLSGHACFALGGAVHPCHPGDVFFIDAHEPHSYPYPASSPDCDHFLIQITRDTVLFRTYSWRDGRELPQRTPNRVLTGAVAAHLLQVAIARLRGDADLPTPFRRHLFRSALGLLVGEIVDQGFRAGPSPGVVPSAQADPIAVVREHLGDTLGRGVTLRSLARLTGYSRFHLLRVFKAGTGQTIHQHLDDLRVAAVRAMSAQGRSRAEMAEVFGFAGPSVLTRWMKARCPILASRGRAGRGSRQGLKLPADHR